MFSVFYWLTPRFQDRQGCSWYDTVGGSTVQRVSGWYSWWEFERSEWNKEGRTTLLSRPAILNHFAILGPNFKKLRAISSCRLTGNLSSRATEGHCKYSAKSIHLSHLASEGYKLAALHDLTWIVGRVQLLAVRLGWKSDHAPLPHQFWKITRAKVPSRSNLKSPCVSISASFVSREQHLWKYPEISRGY